MEERKKKRLIITQKKYDSIISKYNCINNISNLPNKTTIYYSNSDKYIPSKDQKEFISKIKKKNKKIEIIEFNSGHILSHIKFGILNKFKKINWD